MRRHALTGAVFMLLSFAAGLWWQSGAMAQEPAHDHSAATPSANGGTTAKLAPHPQANLPPLELPAFALPKSPDVIRATYKFAAEHPEILSYIPCFCGCEQSGHRGNEDCFVKSRAKNGDVTTWNEHGMVCSMCLAVAEEAMRLNANGASIKEIRADVEQKYGHITEFKTPTPPPPAR